MPAAVSPTVAKVLVVDDEESIAWTLRTLLEGLGHACETVSSAERAFPIVEKNPPDLVILDVKLPGMDGLSALDRMRRLAPAARYLVITAHGTLETAVRAHRLGATEYLLKPLDLDTARERISSLLGGPGLSSEIQGLRGRRDSDSGLVGHSPAMQEVFKKIAAVAASDSSVLLQGESGTGKELVARAIHHNGARSGGPFEAINCASIPETLLESELYGHEEGAFTDAVRQKAGRLEVAHEGTVFLDEVGDLPLVAQVKLLRFLEERQFEHVGGTAPIRVDVRVVSATHQDLEARIREGRFREDLFFRLNVVRIELPPLRNRLQDLPLLVAHFLDHEEGAGISVEAMELLCRHRWPGNIRELRNAIERGVVLARKGPIRPEHLPDAIRTPLPRLGSDENEGVARIIQRLISEAPAGKIFQHVEALWEKALLRLVLDQTDGNQLRAALKLGINRMTLRRKMTDHGL